MKKFVLLFFTLWSAIYSQELPPIQNFSPSDYGAENQNWSISQSNNRLIYVANNKGLLEFNGAEWFLYPSPNQTIMRSVRVIDEKIYTGCYMEFGYWAKNQVGTLIYESISNRFRDKLLEDEEFWNILKVDDLVLFQSKKRIYIYDEASQTLEYLEARTTLPRIWKLGKTVFYHTIDDGLYKIENGEKELVNKEVSVTSDEVVQIMEFNGKILILTRHNGFYQISGDKVELWPTQIDRNLADATVYSALRLSNNTIAIGTISNGLYLLNPDGKLLYQIYMENGLRNNTVLSLFEDMDKSIWLGLDNGLGHVDLNSPFLIYDDIVGDIGSVYSALVFNERVYVGTNQGLFYKPIDSKADFQFVLGTEGQVWQLKEIDGKLFCCHHTGTFVIEDEKARKIEGTEGSWNLQPVKNYANLVIQGAYDGLYILEKKDNSWKLRNKIDGFGNSSRFVELFDSFIFVNHEYKGLFKITPDNEFERVKSVEIDTLLRGDNSAIVSTKEELLYADKKGIFTYDDTTDKFIKDSLLSRMYGESNYTSGKMAAINDEIWFFTKDNINKVSRSSLNNKKVVTQIELGESSRNSISGYENIAPLENPGNYILGTGLGYIILDSNKNKEKNFNVEIAEVEVSSSTMEKNNRQLLDKNEKGDFENHENNVLISYYTPEYGKYIRPKYQYRLLGFYDTWSDWSLNHTASFSNLPYGDYLFEVRSKIGDSLAEKTATFSFTIKKKWYQTNMAIALYAVLGIMGLFFMHLAYRRHYKQRQQKLVERTEKEMRIAKAENEKEIVRLKNEQLKQRVRMKSSELAASTMSLLRKNEVLNEVKKQLEQKVKDPTIKTPITKIIDESLNRNDDWELFKEAFNNADKEFLGKLNKFHTNLTQNDIRLCAYLRLNLSSKEIAPLLNISTKSVEVKRYRLRKKLGLEHDKNLVDYILNL